MATLSSTLYPFPGLKSRAAYGSPTGLEVGLLDDVLIESAKCGDRGAFSVLVERYHTFCLSRAYSILRNRDDAEDEVQDSWIQAWTHLSSYRASGSFRAWLGRIVANECQMRLREARRARLTAIDEVFESDSSSRLELVDQDALAEEKLSEAELSLVLQKAIYGIPFLLREVLLMHDVRRLKIKDIAVCLRISVPAAKSRLRRARAEVRQRLAKHMGAGGSGALLPNGGRQRAVAVYVRAA